MFVEASRELLILAANLTIENPEASANDVHNERRKQTHLVTKNSPVDPEEPFCVTNPPRNGLMDLVPPEPKLM